MTILGVEQIAARALFSSSVHLRILLQRMALPCGVSRSNPKGTARSGVSHYGIKPNVLQHISAIGLTRFAGGPDQRLIPS